MFTLHQHSRLTAAFVACLLILSSSGFTAVLHSCLMAERSCCDRPVNMMAHMPIDDGTLPGQPVLKNNMSCCAVTIAGGLNTNPIVTPSQQSAYQHHDLFALLPAAVHSGAGHILAHPIFFASSSALSPPSVEKYVLNRSFLI